MQVTLTRVPLARHDDVATQTQVLVATDDTAEAGAEDTQLPLSGSPSPAWRRVPKMYQTLDSVPGILCHFWSQWQGGQRKYLNLLTCLSLFLFRYIS